jgi:hypothetical protein
MSSESVIALIIASFAALVIIASHIKFDDDERS